MPFYFPPISKFQFLLLFSIISFTLLLGRIPNENKFKFEKNSTDRKTVLIATTTYLQPSQRTGITCPIECDYHFEDEIQNLTVLASSDAVLFHLTTDDLLPVINLLHYRTKKWPSTNQYSFIQSQTWVIYGVESSDSMKMYTKIACNGALDGIFNWTMSFRHDSTIWLPNLNFIGFHPIQEEKLEKSYYHLQKMKVVNDSKIASKRRHIAAVISNCHDTYGRLAVLEQLKSFGLTVDVYGACSPNNLKCPGRMSSECYEMLEEKYYFYAAFENSLCKDYFSEKLLNIFYYDMVPVVINGADIDQPNENMPAFVDSKNFDTLKDFAEHLLEVTTYADRYQSYFEWRKNYGILYESISHFCRVCMAIQDDQIGKQVPVGNFTNWILEKSECYQQAFSTNSSL